MNTTIIYQIKNWNSTFENNKSREREKCSFCCVPNKQDGLGYGELIAYEEKPGDKLGERLYGAFVAVVLICSKHKRRDGWITIDGVPAECPLSARQLSIKCQYSEDTIQKMLDVVSTNKIGWIIKHQESARRVPAECPPSALEGKGKKGIEGEGSEAPVSLSESQRISFDRELGRIFKELEKLGKLSDHEKFSQKYNRILELRARQKWLRSTLEVVA